MTNDRKMLGQRLRDARDYLGLSQDEVAKATDLTRSAVSLIETGQRKVDALELKKLAELYQQPVAEFTEELEVAAQPKAVAHLTRTAAKLSEADQAELLRFAEFLRAKSPSKGGR